MPDLILINPRAGTEIYGSLGDLVAKEPPLWCRLIAGYVRDRGFTVEIIDCDALEMSPLEAAITIEAKEPQLLAYVVFGHQPSASTQQMVGMRAIANHVDDDVTSIIVGGHVSALPEKTLLDERVDYACKGEGPATIVGLLRDQAKQSIPGLVWRDHLSRSIVINPAATLIPMRELHGNVWDLLPMERYRAHNWQCFGDMAQRQPYASIMTSLGCPYACSFCCINAPFDSNRYRMRDPADVVAEMVQLYSGYGVKTFKIVDEMFVLNERHYTAICNLLIESGIGSDINVWAYARVDTIKPHTLALLRRAGIKWLALGIESGNADVRDGADKALRTEDIVGTVRAIQSADINVIGNFIFGLPDDTHETMRQTLDLALECRTEFANLYAAMAYPGSKLYAEAVAPSDDWATYSQHGPRTRPMGTATLSPADVVAFRDAAFAEYFSDPGYLAHIAGRFGEHAVDYVRQMMRRPMVRQREEVHAG